MSLRRARAELLQALVTRTQRADRTCCGNESVRIADGRNLTSGICQVRVPTLRTTSGTDQRHQILLLFRNVGAFRRHVAKAASPLGTKSAQERHATRDEHGTIDCAKAILSQVECTDPVRQPGVLKACTKRSQDVQDQEFDRLKVQLRQKRQLGMLALSQSPCPSSIARTHEVRHMLMVLVQDARSRANLTG